MEYELIHFDENSEDYIDIETLKDFIKDAEIIISNYGVAWSIDFIKEVKHSLRGATLVFRDDLMTYGYNIESKLVRKSYNKITNQ